MKRRLSLAFFILLTISMLLPNNAGATIKWENNPTSLVAGGGITAGATSVTVTTGQGDRFPVVVSPHYFMMTLIDVSGNREIVKVTARTAGSNTMTIVRAQEGTSAQAFAAGSYVDQRITASSLDAFSNVVDYFVNYYICDASAADQADTVNSASLASLVATIGTSLNATIVLPHSGTGSTTAYNVLQNLDLSAYDNIAFKVEQGAIITHGANTIDMPPPQAGIYQIFSGTGVATFNQNPVIYIEWFGGKADDSTINNTAFTNGIAALSSSGGTIQLLSGVYRIQTTQINLEIPNVKIIGAGMYASTLKQITNGISCLWINTGATDILIQGIKFDGTGAWSNSWAGRTALDINPTDDYPGGSGNPTPKRILIAQCYFVKPDMGGISTDSCEGVTVQGCFFKSVGEHGIYISGTTTKNIKLLNNYFEDTSEATSYLVNLKVVQDLLVDGNTLLSTDGVGGGVINVDPTDPPSNVFITHNYLESTAMSDLLNLGGTNVIVDSNILKGSTVSLIDVRTGARKTIRNNQFHDAAGWTITNTNSPNDVTIENNEAYDCVKGIQQDTPGARFKLRNNKLYHSGGTGTIGFWVQAGANVDAIFEDNLAIGYSTPYAQVQPYYLMRNNRDSLTGQPVEFRFVLGAGGAGVADGTTAGKAQTTNSTDYLLERLKYTKAATDDLFDLTGVTTGGAEYKKVVLCLDSSGNGQIVEGVVAASQVAAALPWVRVDWCPVGVVEIGISYSGGDLAGNTFWDILGNLYQ